MARPIFHIGNPKREKKEEWHVSKLLQPSDVDPQLGQLHLPGQNLRDYIFKHMNENVKSSIYPNSSAGIDENSKASLDSSLAANIRVIDCDRDMEYVMTLKRQRSNHCLSEGWSKMIKNREPMAGQEIKLRFKDDAVFFKISSRHDYTGEDSLTDEKWHIIDLCKNEEQI